MHQHHTGNDDAHGEHAQAGSFRRLVRADRSASAALLLLACLSGCQTYQPSPLDPTAHHAAWNARALDREGLQQFLDRLEQSPDTPRGSLELTDGLSLEEGQLVAMVFNPALRLARLEVKRAAAGRSHSGSWPDPEFELSAMRITESVPDRWVVAPALTFSLPLSGRLDAERGLADAELEVARAALREAEWSVHCEVLATWIEWSAARLRVRETEGILGDLGGLVRMTQGLAERGEIPSTEASLFRVEELQLRNRKHRLAGEAEALEQQLRALLGLAPAAPIELLPSLEPGTRTGELEGAPYRADALERRNPQLARLRRKYEVAEQSLRHEVRKQYPDMSIGPLFEADAGQSRIGLLGAIPIPLLHGNRRAIAEARVDREVARAAVETTLEILVAQLAVATARVVSLGEQRESMEQVLAPAVTRQLEDALELLRLGEGTTLVLLESLTRAFQARLDLIELRSAEALAKTRAVYLVGPPAPEQPSAAAEETNR